MIRPLDVNPPSTALAAEGVAVAGDGRQPSTDEAAVTRAAPTRAEVEAAIDTANDVLDARHAALEFRIDPDTHSVVVRLVDTQNDQVLRQIPSEEMLAIAKAVDRFELTLLRNQA